MLSLDAVAFIVIYYMCMVSLCYLYSNSRFYKEDRVFINYDIDYSSNDYINTKKMA